MPLAEFDAMLRDVGLSKAGVSPSLAAHLAGISPQAIHRAIQRGTLEASIIQPAGAHRALVAVSLASLRAYVARNRPASGGRA